MISTGFRPPPGPAPIPEPDAAQRALIDLPDDVSVAVLGAPGTGKTTALVELVAERVLRRAWEPEQILVLAPGRLAATRLRDRIAQRLARPTGGPLVRSWDSYAFQLVGQEATRLGRPAPRFLSGARQDQVLGELIEGQILDAEAAGSAETAGAAAWPAPLTEEVRRLTGFRTELREFMMRATQLGLGPERIAALAAEDHPEWRAAAALIHDYQAVLDQYDAEFRDSAELIAEATAIVQRMPVAPLRLLLVEDAQELALGEQALLAALGRLGVAVIALGDPDIAAGAFRGARPESLARLGSLLGREVPPPIILNTVHRGAGEVDRLRARVVERIGAAGSVAHRATVAPVSPAEQPVPASPVSEEGVEREGDRNAASRASAGPTVVEVHRAIGREQEFAHLARRLREEHLLGRVPWSEFAVVVRSQSLIPPLRRALAAAEVPATVSAGGRALRDDYAAGHLAELLAVVLGVHELTPERAVSMLLGPFGGLDPVALRRLRLALRHEELAGDGHRSSDELLVEALGAAGGFATIDGPAGRRAGRLAGRLAAARAAAAEGATVEELLWQLWDGSGLAVLWSEQSASGGVLAAEADRHLDGAVALFSAATRAVERNPDQSPREFIEQFLGAPVPEDTLAPRSRGDAVLVTTPAALTGTEFEVVAIAGIQEGVWPNPRLRGSLLHADAFVRRASGEPEAAIDERRQVLSDELRMFALSLSRSRRLLLLSAVDSEEEQPSAILRLAEEVLAAAEAAIAAGSEEDGTGAAGASAAEDRRRRSDRRLPMSLRALSGRLRRLLTDPELAVDEPETVAAAATALARLAAEGVPGADPAQWYGLRELSTDAPLNDLSDPESPVSVSPSSLEKFEKSPLAWFIEKVAAGSSGQAAAMGTLLHSAMEQGSEAERVPGAAELWVLLDERWNELQFESPWLEQAERRKAEAKVEGIVAYLRSTAADGTRLVAAEESFSVPIGPAVLHGTIDRVEATSDGRIVIADLKTGRFAPSAKELPEHAQLLSYQLSVLDGALPLPEGARLGGAKLIFLDWSASQPFKELGQTPLEAEKAEEFRGRVRRAAEGMAAAVFPGETELGERDPVNGYRFRLHLVPAVSA